MFARILVGLWLVLYGKFHIRGVGLLIRLCHPFVAGLRAYPLEVPGVGTIPLNLREPGAYGMLIRFKLGDPGSDAGLYRAMEWFLKPGAVLWDVGAFAGYIAAHFAHPRLQLASVEAFEPNPAALAALGRLFAGSRVVHVHPFGLGNADKSMELSVDPEQASTASLVQRANHGEAIRVQVRQGDTARKDLNLPLPDVVKIDVEGFEPEVVAGLAETIAQKRPVLFFEHVFLSEAQLQAIVPKAYALFFIRDDGQIAEDPAFRGQGHDAFLVPAERKGEVQQLVSALPPSGQRRAG